MPDRAVPPLSLSDLVPVLVALAHELEAEAAGSDAETLIIPKRAIALQRDEVVDVEMTLLFQRAAKGRDATRPTRNKLRAMLFFDHVSFAVMIEELAALAHVDLPAVEDVPSPLRGLMAVEVRALAFDASLHKDASGPPRLDRFWVTLSLDKNVLKLPDHWPAMLRSGIANAQVTLSLTAHRDAKGGLLGWKQALLLEDLLPLPAKLPGQLAISVNLSLGKAMHPRARAVYVPPANGPKATCAALLEEVVPLPTALRHFGTIEVDAFEIEVAGSEQTVSLDLGPACKPHGAGPALEGVSIFLEHNTDGITGEITATILLAGKESAQAIVIDVGAELHGPHDGVLFSGALHPDGLEPMSVTTLIGTLAESFGAAAPDLPSALQDVAVEKVSLNFDTGTGAADFLLEVDATLAGDTDIAVTLHGEIAPANNIDPKAALGRTIRLTAVAHIETGKGTSLDIDLAFVDSGDGVLLAGDVRSDQGIDIDIGAMLGSAMGDGMAGLGAAVSVGRLAIVKGPNGVLAAGISLGAGLDLSRLALPHLPLGAATPLALHFDLSAGYAKGTDTARKQAQQSLLDALPDFSGLDDLEKSGLNYSLDVSWPGHSFKMASGSGQNESSGQDEDKGQANSQLTVAPSSAVHKKPALAPPTKHGDFGPPTVLGFHGQFGPVHVSKVAVSQMAELRAVRADIYGAIKLGGIELALIDFSTTLQRAAPHGPEFDLAGLGLSLSAGGAQISGAFLHHPIEGGGQEFAGAANITFENLSLDAIGAFSKGQNGTSLFVFADLHTPIGGPPAFFIEGVAAGFGLHRRVNMPAIEDIPHFSLIEMSEPGNAPIERLTDALSRIDADIPPDPGATFFAAGVQASSFGMANTNLLAIVQTEDGTTINILGHSKASMPPAPAVNGAPPLMRAELALDATIRPAEGTVLVEARLIPGSYVYSPFNRIHGGFAFAAWFKDRPNGARAGDFVLTLGGYHPSFRVPAHYPQAVPRLGYRWQVSSILHIEGELYFALTPNVLMAGGRIDARVNCGAVQAWFTCGADFLITFKPFHYDAHLSLAIGASVRISLVFTHVTITISAAADLHLWGPQLTGHAHVSLKVLGVHVHFDANFGAAPPLPAPISWAEFQQSFLGLVPSKSCADQGKKMLAITIEAGLERRATFEGKQVWVVNGHDLVLRAHSRVPAAKAVFMRGEKTVSSHDAVNVAPMGICAAQGVTLGLEFLQGDAGSTLATTSPSGFTLSPVVQAVPAGLWSAPALTADGHIVPADVNSPATVEAMTAIRLVAGEPTHAHTSAIDRSALKYDNIELPEVTEYSVTPAVQALQNVAFDIPTLEEEQRQLARTLGLDPTTVALRSGVFFTFATKPLARKIA